MCLNQGAPYKLSARLHLQTFRSVSLPFFFCCPGPASSFLPNTMRQDPPGCYDFRPVSVWNAATDCLDSRTGRRYVPRFKEELLSGTAGRGTQTPRSVSNPDPAGRNGTVSRSHEVQREALDGGNNAAVLRVVTQLLGLITARTRLFHGGSGEKAGRLDVERAQQLAPEWAAIHESDWRIRMVFVTFDMPLASTVSAVNMVGNCW